MYCKHFHACIFGSLPDDFFGKKIVVLSILKRPKQPCLFFSEFDVQFQFVYGQFLLLEFTKKI